MEDNCIWALTNEAEEQKHVLANRESGDVSWVFLDLLFFCFLLFFSALLPTDGEPAERRRKQLPRTTSS